MQRPGYLVFRLIVGLISLLPFWLLYRISDLLFFLLRYIFRYRYRIIQENIRNSFPEKPDWEIDRIVRDYYRNFSDILLEAPKGLTLSAREMKRRYRLTNIELLDDNRWGEHPRLVASGHFTNWEWGSQAISLFSAIPVIGVYKQLKNKLVENYLTRLRTGRGMYLTEMGQVGRTLVQFKDKPSIFVFIADQTPPDPYKSHWRHFLNQDTPFLPGLDKIARRTGYPVFYAEIQRVRRGWYEVTFSPLMLDPKAAPEGEITRRYAQKLEENICQTPAHWLWSHRRWKLRRPAGMAILS